MTSIKDQLREDKAIRDAAREVIDLDVAHVKTLASPDALRGRTVTPAADRAQALRKNAAETASDNKGKIAAIVGAAASAAILWAVREPLMALIDELTAPSENTTAEEEEPNDA
ncbi:MAG: hypothetical protein ABJP34_09335 [Erythrobacter sp.]